MQLTRPYQFSRRTHILILPTIYFLVAGVIYLALYFGSKGGFIRTDLPAKQIIGTLILFVIMPSYFIAMMALQWQRTEAALVSLTALARAKDIETVRSRLESLPRLISVFLVLGFLFGLSQNILFVKSIIGQPALASALDVAFILGNCVIWCMVTLMLCWRLPVARGLSTLGENMQVDLYRMEQLQPFANVAIVDVLVVAGALAMQPLQALDAEFRVWNFQAGFIVGVTAALLLFLVPLIGIRNNIFQTKAQRVTDLQLRLSDTNSNDIASLETLSAHISRIQKMPNWPINLPMLTRVLAYIVLPPLAWVGAALVENLVDAF